MAQLIEQVDGLTQSPTGENQPMPALSFEELIETAVAIGNPGAFRLTCGHVEQLIQTSLIWKA